ncbi:MAG: glycoside hydrolase family 73 protein [Chitinophagaceae bacterium]
MKVKIKLLFLSLIATVSAFSQKEKASAYVDTYKDIAIKEMQRSGVPAAITLAQGILESQYGESELSKKSNNHFGIKCKLDWTGEKVYHDDDTRQECFRKYPTAADSYKDHSDFLKSRPHYASLFTLNPTDFESWARGLKKAGYATESNYPEMLIKVINDYNLNQYTLIALNKLPNNLSDSAFAQANNNEQTKKTITTTIVEDEKDEIENIDTRSIKRDDVAKAVEKYPDGIFTINGCKVIYAMEGTSLLALAQQYNITYAKILEMNDLDETSILDRNQLIFLEKKQKKGLKDFHIAAANETLQQISQKEGVRMDMLVEYNSTHRKLNPLIGEKIYLRGKALVPPKMSLAVANNTLQNTSTIN